MTHVSSYDKPANALTKPLLSPCLHNLCVKICLALKTVLWGLDKNWLF